MAQARTFLPLGKQNLQRDQLKKPPENPKLPIEREKLDALKESIREDPGMMLARPIGVADGPKGKMGGFVWGGNQRIDAIEELYRDGWTSDLWPAGTYPCDVQDIDRKTALERLHRDNAQFAEWDPRKAMPQLEELKKKGSNLAALGWDQKQMDALLRQAEELKATTGAAAATNGTAGAPTEQPPPPPPDGDAEGGPGTEYLDEDAAAGDPDMRFPEEAQPPQLGDDLHEFVLRVTVEQRDAIMGAVHAQRRLDPDQTTAEALASVCQFWTDAHKAAPAEVPLPPEVLEEVGAGAE